VCKFAEFTFENIYIGLHHRYLWILRSTRGTFFASRSILSLGTDRPTSSAIIIDYTRFSKLTSPLFACPSSEDDHFWAEREQRFPISQSWIVTDWEQRRPEHLLPSPRSSPPRLKPYNCNQLFCNSIRPLLFFSDDYDENDLKYPYEHSIFITTLFLRYLYLTWFLYCYFFKLFLSRNSIGNSDILDRCPFGSCLLTGEFPPNH